MENTKNKLTYNEKIFFDNLKVYIDKPIYFYGSIQRSDYLPGKSDVDIDIFTENETTTIYALCNYLNLNKSDFRKSVYKIKNKIINGYKTKYIDEKNEINTELAIYNIKNKEIILKEHSRNLVLPFYLSFVLTILKILYYNLQVISNESFKRCKQFLMNENNERKFIILDM
jgi:hypothetical protein